LKHKDFDESVVRQVKIRGLKNDKKNENFWKNKNTPANYNKWANYCSLE